MKIYTPIGSKKRLFEMIEKVNKIRINENDDRFNYKNILETSFSKLMNGTLAVNKQAIETNGDGTYVTLECGDDQNNVTFRFKTTANETDQEGMYAMNEALLIEFKFENNTRTMNLDENGLKEFNGNHKNELLDIVSEYVDFEENTPEMDEEYMDAVKKIDSYPFGGTPRTMQTASAYADEKPTNPNLRVNAPELKKFVDENNMGEFEDDDFDYPDLEIPYNKNAEKQASKDIGQHFTKKGHPTDFDTPSEKWRKYPLGYNRNTVFPEDDMLPRSFTESEESEIDVEQLAQDREETGDMIHGGMGDDKSPLDFDKEQIILGMKVEMEHSDNPMIVLEIVMDHLSEDPEYYTVKDDPEASAQFNAASDAEEKTDPEKESPELYPDGWKEMDGMFMGPNNSMNSNNNNNDEMTDVLLGYKPKNVGDSIDEELINKKKQNI